MSNKFTSYLLMVLLLLSASSLYAQTNTALSFNSGTQDHATTTNGFVIPQMNPGDNSYLGITVEFWVYIPAYETGTHSFISQGGSGLQFAIGYNDNHHIYLGDFWQDANVNLPVAQWNHIALVSNANDSTWLYLNGVAADSDLIGGYFYIAAGTQLQLGTDVDSTTFFTGTIDQVRIWNYARTPAQIKAGMYGPVDSTSPGLLGDYLFDANPGVTHNSGNTGNADLTLLKSTTTVSSPVQPGNNGVRFSIADHTNIHTDTTSTALDLSVGTIEAYVNPNTVNGTIINLGSDLNHTRFSVHLDNTSPTAAFNTIGIRNSIAPNTVQTIFYPAGFTAGKWYQLAFVTDHDVSGDTTGVYVNGNYAGRIATGYDVSAGSKLALTIGANGIDNSENWDGSIDEVRVWNVPLTQSQIVTNLISTLTGNEPNLVALYSFDQGIPDGDNTGMTLAIDNSPQTNNATLSNFSLANTGTNFTAHAMVPLPLTLLQFTATKQSNTSILQWQTGQEQNTRDFVIERSSDGSNYTDIGTVGAAGNSNTKRYYNFTDIAPLEGNNYYRLKQRDLDGQSTYSPVRMLSFSMSGNLIWYSTGANQAEVRLHNGSNELYTIVDMAGNTLRTSRLSSGVASISNLPSGIYFVKVVTYAGNELTVKVLLR
ncbi:MAG TPA: LamG-like jellyroll fold domain-containing protein [Puia sp.]|nr:LamG-like jellyroll fold domain-containing protein [Puia sp.]